MADFGLAAQIGRGSGGGGVAPTSDPMNRLSQLMQLEQMQQNMLLARDQNARQRQLFGPQLQAAQSTAERAGLELKEKQLDKETADKLWSIYQSEDDPYSPEVVKRLRKTDPRVASQLEKLASDRNRAVSESMKSRIDADKARFDLNKGLADFLVSIEPTVNDQASYSVARRRFLENNPDQINAFPEEYSPENKARLFSTLNRLRSFQVIRTAEGDDIVYDPITKTRRLLTEEGPVEIPSTGAATPAPAGAAAPSAAGAAQPSAANMTANMLRRFEGFAEKPYWDVNAYRTGYGSDTITRADGTVERVTPETVITREDAERDLQRRVDTEFLPRAVQAVGRENWSALPPGTQAALTSITYNYGQLPPSVAQAARTGDPNLIAAAVEALAPANQGINANRRIQEAAVIRGTGLLPGNQTVPSMTLAPTVNIPGSAPMGVNALAPMPMPPANAMVAPPQPTAPAIAPQIAATAPAATIGLTPAQERKLEAERQTALARSRAQEQAKKESSEADKQRARQSVQDTLDGMIEAYKNLASMGELQTPETGFLGRAAIAARARLPGDVATVVSPQAGPELTTINNLRQSLIPVLTEVMGAKAVDAARESEAILASLTSGGQSPSAIARTLNNFSKKYGLGVTIDPKDLTPAPPSSGIPRGRRGSEPAAAESSAKPTLQQFLEKARPMNRGVSDAELTEYYNRTYGGR